MHSILAGTGPLYAVADPSDHYHQRVIEEMEKIQKDRLQVILAYPVLCETYTLIMGNLSIKFSHKWLSEIYELVALLNPATDDYRAAKDIALKFSDRDISLLDAIIPSISSSLKIPVWTYDSDFNVLGTDVWRH